MFPSQNAVTIALVPASDGMWRLRHGVGSLAPLAGGQIAMSYVLSELPLWALILAVMIIPTSLAIGCQVLIRRSFGVDTLALNNEVAGFIFAIIGVVYAVLLAFVVIAVWEKFSEGQTSVARESAAAAALF